MLRYRLGMEEAMSRRNVVTWLKVVRLLARFGLGLFAVLCTDNTVRVIEVQQGIDGLFTLYLVAFCVIVWPIGED